MKPKEERRIGDFEERKKRYKKSLKKKGVRESELTYTVEEVFKERKGFLNYKRLIENFTRRDDFKNNESSASGRMSK
jgi:hypothetical protein